jgi:aldose 1-epimerase
MGGDMAGDVTEFGRHSSGAVVHRIRLTAGDLSVSVLSLGAVVQDVRLAGVDHPLTLGSPDVAAYEGEMGYFGAVVGPVANRIAGAEAVIAGRTCRFPANEGTTILHGGPRGTHARLWDLVSASAEAAELRLTLPAGDDGFPGHRIITALFRVTDASLTLDLSATTDAATIFGLANHSYWNLDGTPTIAGHRLTVAADAWLPTVNSIPTGEVRPAAGTFDLRAGRVIDLTEGYDHNFCLAQAPRALTEIARLTGQSGLTLRIASTAPGLQVYDGNFLDGTGPAGHDGYPYARNAGLALEPQMWPDAPNHAHFPSIALTPGAPWRQQSRWTLTRG